MERIGDATLAEIRKEAAAWLVEMDSEPERWNRQGFVAWLKSSPRHMEEFLEQTALWVTLHRDIDRAGIDLHQLLKENPGNVVNWPESARNRSQGTRVNRRRWWLASLAATLMIVVSATGLWSLLHDDAEVLTTVVGEQRAIRLDDGSVIHLNTDSGSRFALPTQPAMCG